jgi:UDP-N-acetylglucosamine 2-epimerase (non-hydrolysing)
MIHIIIGTKAQLVKMAPVMVHLMNRNVQYNFIYTGQHRATIEEMLIDFGVKQPDITLYEGKDITSIFHMLIWTFRLIYMTLLKKKEIFCNDKNGIVLVHGDTLSTILGAVMGKIAGLKIGHVESGLRSFNLFHPFPEEITRVLTFRLSDVLFCPGEWAIDNVAHLNKTRINTIENTLYDSISLWDKRCNRSDHIPEYPFILVSLHRFENIFNRKNLELVVDIVENISSYHKIIFILHKPTEKKLKQMSFFDRLKNNPSIEFRERYNHSDFISLLKSCLFVVTDGGSLQEETDYFGIPCLLLRKATERREGLGSNVVVSNYDLDIIENFCKKYHHFKKDVKKVETSPSQLISDELQRYY